MRSETLSKVTVINSPANSTITRATYRHIAGHYYTPTCHTSTRHNNRKRTNERRREEREQREEERSEVSDRKENDEQISNTPVWVVRN